MCVQLLFIFLFGRKLLLISFLTMNMVANYALGTIYHRVYTSKLVKIDVWFSALSKEKLHGSMIFYPNEFNRCKYVAYGLNKAELLFLQDIFKLEYKRYMKIVKAAPVFLSKNEDVYCGLCFESFRYGVKLLKCKHSFHKDCFWASMNGELFYCPTCKVFIIE